MSDDFGVYFFQFYFKLLTIFSKLERSLTELPPYRIYKFFTKGGFEQGIKIVRFYEFYTKKVQVERNLHSCNVWQDRNAKISIVYNLYANLLSTFNSMPEYSTYMNNGGITAQNNTM